jgi:Domain of unknown function (DUF5664)
MNNPRPMLSALEPSDPNPKKRYGMAKAPMHFFAPTARILCGIVMQLGGTKYGPFNWRANAVDASTYIDAIHRHLMLWESGEDNDEESKVSHLAHVMACCSILIDAQLGGTLIDDRSKSPTVAELLKSLTKPLV